MIPSPSACTIVPRRHIAQILALFLNKVQVNKKTHVHNLQRKIHYNYVHILPVFQYVSIQSSVCVSCFLLKPF